MADRDRDHREPPSGDDEGFLRRWSRRKAEARREIEPEQPQAAADPPAARGEDAEPPVRVEDLPDIATLDAGSDFKPFLRPGVPEHLRKLALRKMWRVDPMFSKLDGLVEYGEDYTFASRPGGVIKTAYQVGRGFVSKLEELAPAGDRAEEAAAAERETPPAAESPKDAATSVAADEAPSITQSEESADLAPAAQPGAQPASAPAEPPPARPDQRDRRRPRPLPRRG